MTDLFIKANAISDKATQGPQGRDNVSALAGLAVSFQDMIHKAGIRIEPTESESLEELDRFCDAMIAIIESARRGESRHKEAPFSLPVRRLDDVKAARNLDLAYKVPAE